MNFFAASSAEQLNTLLLSSYAVLVKTALTDKPHHSDPTNSPWQDQAQTPTNCL